jgi:hypothetical protein
MMQQYEYSFYSSPIRYSSVNRYPSTGWKKARDRYRLKNFKVILYALENILDDRKLEYRVDHSSLQKTDADSKVIAEAAHHSLICKKLQRILVNK